MRAAVSKSLASRIFGTFRRPVYSAGRWAFTLVELVVAIVDSLILILPLPTSTKACIVLVPRLDGIGDYCLWLPSARALRHLYTAGEYKIYLVANEQWAALAKRETCFDGVLSVNRRRFLVNPVYRYRSLRKIRGLGASICIHPAHSREFLKGDAIVRLCGAQRRIGSRGDLSNNSRLTHAISSRWYTELAPCGDATEMELQRNAKFMRYLGLPQFSATLPTVPSDGQLPDGLTPGGYYVVVPGASKAGKRWPTSRFAEIASRIHSETGWVGVVCGGSGDIDVARRTVQLSNVPMSDLTNRTTITGLVAVIDAATLVVSNDTGAVHIAAACNTPAVCILGGWHYGRYHPYTAENRTGAMAPTPVTYEMPCFGCNWRCIYGVGPSEPKPCVGEITVESVWGSVQRVLHNDNVSRD